MYLTAADGETLVELRERVSGFEFRFSSFGFGGLGSRVTGLRIVGVQASASQYTSSKKVINKLDLHLASADGDFLVECLSG